MKDLLHGRKIFCVLSIALSAAIFCAALMIFIGCGDSGKEASRPPTVLPPSEFSVRYYAGEGGYIAGEAEQKVAFGDSASAVTATSNDGYEFVKWSDGVTEATRRAQNVQSDIHATALFEKKRYAVRFLTDGNGTIEGAAAQSVAHGGKTSKVTAVPHDGYEFVKWSDDRYANVRIDYDITSSYTVTAVFGKAKLSARYSALANGRILGDADQTVLYGESATAVTAKPHDGYEFVKWSDGVTEATRRDENIRQSLNVKAEFIKIEFFNVEYRITGNGEGTIEGDTLQKIGNGRNATTVTAVPQVGCEFVRWRLLEVSQTLTTDTPHVQNGAELTAMSVCENRVYLAEIRRIEYRVDYKSAVYGGTIEYIKESRPIYYGGQGPTVRAETVFNDGLVFLYWSDGKTTPERTEYNVTCNMEFTAYFGYRAEYKVNNGVGGRIAGNAYQTVLPDADFTAVQAVPDAGYVFGGWSDLNTESERHDKDKRSIEHIAYFEPIERTFKLDYGIASGTPLASSITINRDDIKLDGYITPEMSGYTFEGWYADKEYKLKAINADGRYMLGYYGFSLETDALYARWKRLDDDSRTYKILLVFVNEIDAKLYPAKTGGNDGLLHDVHYRMTAAARAYCALVHSYFSKYLTEWLASITSIEVDAYYTTQTQGEKCFGYVPGVSGSYALIQAKSPEVSVLITSYHSVLSVFGINNEDGKLANKNISGEASEKYGDVYFETQYRAYILNHLLLGEFELGQLLGTFLHEFIHTCEQSYDDGEIMNFHDSFYENYRHDVANELEYMRRYLLCELEYNGEIGGIPRDFWTDKCDRLLPLLW